MVKSVSFSRAILKVTIEHDPPLINIVSFRQLLPAGMAVASDAKKCRVTSNQELRKMHCGLNICQLKLINKSHISINKDRCFGQTA